MLYDMIYLWDGSESAALDRGRGGTAWRGALRLNVPAALFLRLVITFFGLALRSTQPARNVLAGRDCADDRGG